MPRRKKTRILKIEYQRILGKQISIRQWQRVLQTLRISDEDFDQLPIVRAYAHLRKLSPRNTFTRLDAQEWLFISENMPSLTCYGYQLKEALLRMHPRPSIPTIYRWGKEIGVRFSLERKYLPSELNLWLERVLISKFRVTRLQQNDN